MTAKDAFLLHLDQPAELVALLEHDSIHYAVWTRPDSEFDVGLFNVHVFHFDPVDPNPLILMRSGVYDLDIQSAMQLVADLMRGVTV